ncbi:MAG: MBL fold metallo-hydrolase, partial [Clostridia bacterium]|nr:MBL fold metallo-hydrolase [Clostridia bacterium]
FLFTGDAEEERITEYLKGNDADCDVLKVPHHGVWNAKTDALVSASTPRYALITSSDGEPEDEKTVSLLESNGAEAFLTRKDTVTVVSDGESIYAYYGN